MQEIPLKLTEFAFDFSKCYPPCSESDMDENFLKQLEAAWEFYPFKLNSAYRSPQWERAHGRRGTSAHCVGRAVDISTKDSRTRWCVFDALVRAGFTRIGIGKTFLHVDNDVNASRPERCLFLE